MSVEGKKVMEEKSICKSNRDENINESNLEFGRLRQKLHLVKFTEVNREQSDPSQIYV